MSQPSKPPSDPLACALWCTKTQRGWAVGAVGAVTVAVLLQRVRVYVIKLFTDAAGVLEGSQSDFSELWFWALLYPCLYVLNAVIWRTSGFCGMRWLTGVSATVYQQLFNYLTGQSAGYFSDRFAGALTNKISNAARGLESLLADSLWQLWPLCLGSIATGVILYLGHPLLALEYGIWLIVFICINLWYVKRLHKYSMRYAETSSELKGKIVDSTSNIESVHQAAHSSFEQNYVGKFVDKQRTAHLKSWMVAEGLAYLNFAAS